MPLPRRIAYVLKVFPKLSETFILGELVELRRRGVDLRILSLLPPREELRHELVALAGLSEAVCYEPREFSKLLRQFQPELLHAHFATESAAAARELAAEQGIPFTFTAHGYDIFRKPPADFGVRARAAAALITVSRANATYITQTFGVPPSRVRVIGCGVDTDRFCPANGSARVAGQPLIVCVARHVQVKNLELLLRACAGLRDAGQSFRCALVGDGPCRAELTALRASLGLEGLVEMPGAAEQREVVGWWQRAAVGALTSHSEGLPVSLMEAAACGVPVVATAVGGVPELVGDGVTGLLVSGCDPARLAVALGRLLRDDELRRQMGTAARRRAEKEFSVTRQVGRLLELWSEILEARS